MSVWKKIIQENKKEQKSVNLRVEKTMSYHQMRRVLSEAAVEKELPWHFEDGVSYHVLSWGDVDALTCALIGLKDTFFVKKANKS